MNVENTTTSQLILSKQLEGAGEAERQATILFSLLLTGVTKTKSGAAFLNGQQFGPAMKDFVEALNNIKDLMQKLDELNQSLSQLQVQEKCPTHEPQEDMIAVRIETDQSLALSSNDYTSKNFVFSFPLLLQFSHQFPHTYFFQELANETGCDTIRKNLRKAANAIIFNMALVYHLKGLLEETSRTKKALSLYELCYKTLEEEDFEILVFYNDPSSSSPSCSTRLLYKLVILNNLSQLLSAVGSYEVAFQLKQILLTVLIWLVQEFKARKMNPSILESFFQTTMCLMVHDSVTAPAA